MADAPSTVGLVSRPGFNDVQAPRVAEDPYDCLQEVPGFIPNPFGPDPVRLTQNSNP
jgi:hypothetical protein